MHTLRRTHTWAFVALLLAAVWIARPAHGAPNVEATFGALGWRHGESMGGGESTLGSLASVSVASAAAARPESILGEPALDVFPAPAWTVRGFVRGMAVVGAGLRRGSFESGAFATTGPLYLSAGLSYGRAPSFQDRYWRSGRDRLVPGLALGGQGFSWMKGPTDLRALSFQAMVDTPLLLRGDGDFSWGNRASVDLGGSLRALDLHRLRDGRHFDLGLFAGTVRRYGDGRLLAIGIDVLAFHTQPASDGWIVEAAIGMSALRLTPAPHPDGAPSPGQAVPAARVGVGYRNAATVETTLGTFHRLDPTGQAIDRGGAAQFLVSIPMGLRWSARAAADILVARRVRVDAALDPAAPGFHAWLIQRQLSLQLSYRLGTRFTLHANAFAEKSDRDNPLLFPLESARMRTLLGAFGGLAWHM